MIREDFASAKAKELQSTVNTKCFVAHLLLPQPFPILQITLTHINEVFFCTAIL